MTRCDNCDGTGQVFASLAGEEPDLHSCRECKGNTVKQSTVENICGATALLLFVAWVALLIAAAFEVL